MSLSDSPLCTFSSLAPSLLLEKFWVQQWQGEDKLSKPYRFTLRLATKNSLLNDESLLGERGVLTFFEELAAPHTYHGVVTEVAYLDSDAIYHYYQVILEPRVTKLRHFYFSEIWLDKSLPELIRDVLLLADLKVEGPGLSGAPVDAYDFDIRIPRKDIALTQAPFTCQFEESSFAFLSRLLEYFGIYYFFEQGAQGEALVFCGDRQYQPQTPSVLTYRRQDSELEVGQGLAVVRSFERKLVQQVAQIHLQDFSASKADVQLHCSASVAAASLAADAPLEQHQQLAQSAEFIGVRGVYGEHFGSTEAGQWLATRRAQAIGCRHREFHGAGRAGQVRAGYPVLLAGHPRLLLNTTYHVIEVSHQGYQPLPGLGQGGEMAANVATRFVALPVDVQFRPACTTPKPWVQGLLSAIVEGDEHSDMPLLNEHGCYKVSFPFIRGSKNATRGSAWVRMATPSSGSGHGMNFPLLKGAEVLVSFLGGDPDRPVIVGSVPNSANPNRVNERNVTQSGLSTPGGHVLAMEDRPAGKMMLMSTPTGSAFSLGQGAVKGAHLRTNDHMQFASTSYQHEVPGVYKMTVTGGVPPAPIAPASPEGGLANNFNDAPKSDSERIKDIEEELEKRKKSEKQAAAEAQEKEDKAGVIKTDDSNNWIAGEASITPRIMTEAKITTVQLSASAGGFKGDVNLQASSFETSLAGPKWEFSVNLFNRNFELGKYYIHELKQEKSLNKIESNVIYSLQSVNRRDQSTSYNHISTVTHTITVGQTSITLTPKAILLKAESIFIDGDLNVTGDVVLQKHLRTSGSTYIKGSAYINNALDVDSVTTNKLDAPPLKAGEPIIPDTAAYEDGLAIQAKAKLMKSNYKIERGIAITANEALDGVIDAKIAEEEAKQVAAAEKFFKPM